MINFILFVLIFSFAPPPKKINTPPLHIKHRLSSYIPPTPTHTPPPFTPTLLQRGDQWGQELIDSTILFLPLPLL